MRTREEIAKQDPLLWDVLVWLPSKHRFERHGSRETLPQDEDAIFLTDLSDLVTIFPSLTANEVAQWGIKLMGEVPRVTKGSEYAKMWWILRHMHMTIEGQPSVPFPIPRRYIPNFVMHSVEPKKRGRPLKYRTAPSGKSDPNSPKGVQRFHVLYQPGNIEAQDLIFADMSPMQQCIVLALLDAVKKKGSSELTREELVEALNDSKELNKRTNSTPWDSFIRYRAALVRYGFLAEAPPPGSTKWRADWKPVMPPLPRYRVPGKAQKDS